MRAYVAGVGTAGSLLGAAALLFVLASAFVAFHGWPKVAAEPAPASIVVSPRSTAGASPADRRLAAIAARPPVGLHALHPARPGRSASAGAPAGAPRARTSGRVFVAGGPAAAGPAPSRSGAGVARPPARSCPSGCGAPPSVPGVVSQTTHAVEHEVSTVPSQIGSTIAGVTDTAANALRNATAGGTSVPWPPAGALGGT